MLSVNNASVLSGLQMLSQATTALNKAETAISTGKTVFIASDKPTIYSIAKSMQALSAVLSRISQGRNILGQVVHPLINNTQIAQTLGQIDSMASSATFNGVNLLAGTLVNGVNHNTASTALDTYWRHTQDCWKQHQPRFTD